jgi:cell division protein FtsW (lipid II flippase)
MPRSLTSWSWGELPPRSRLFSVAALLLVCAALLAACGSETSPPSKAEVAKQEFEDATLTRVGPFAFVKLDPQNFSAEQRQAMRAIFGGRWVSNGFLIPVQKLAAVCRAEVLSQDACRAFFRR